MHPRPINAYATTAVRMVCLALATGMLSWGSLQIRGGGEIAPVWPANGVLLAVLLLTRPRHWPLWLAAGLSGMALGNLADGAAPGLALQFTALNLVEVALSAVMIRAFGGEVNLARLKFLLAAAVAALVSSTIGAAGAGLIIAGAGGGAQTVSLTWALSDALGQMTAAPIVLAGPTFRFIGLPLRRIAALTAALAGFVATTGVLAYSARLDLLFLTLAPLMVLVFQLEVAGAALATLLASVLAMILSARLGALASVPGDPINTLQIYLMGSLMLNMPIAAVLADRRAAHESARQSHARLEFLGDHSRDIVMRLGQDQTILDVSPSIRQFGYTPDELVGEPAGRRTHPDDRERLLALFKGLTPGTRMTGQMQEWRARTADGRWVWMEGDVTANATPGEEAEYVLVMRDISERLRATEALTASEARYRLLAENSRDAVFAFDDKSNILYASPAIRALGWEPEQLIGRSCFEFVHPDDVATARAAMAATLRRESTADVNREWRLRTASGDYVWVEGNPSVSWDEDGRPFAWSDSVRDISRRKFLEADLEAKRREADAAREAREAAEARARESLDELARVARAMTVGEFASSIAHEINQPLAAIVTNGDTALRWLSRSPPEVGEARGAVERAIRDARRASDIIVRTRQMLAKSTPQLEALDVAGCIDDVLVFVDAEVRRCRVKVSRSVAKQLPHALGDRVQVQQVLLNLARNAIDAMAENGGEARALEIRASHLEDSHEILVQVNDTGCGLTQESAARLFESFFSTKPGGVGLGLAISRSIIEAHGGRLWATPRQDRGASLQFTLRAAPESQA